MMPRHYAKPRRRSFGQLLRLLAGWWTGLRGCDDCGGWGWGPMLHDELWLSIAKRTDLLCMGCMEKRLGRQIELADLSKHFRNDSDRIWAERLDALRSGRPAADRPSLNATRSHEPSESPSG